VCGGFAAPGGFGLGGRADGHYLFDAVLEADAEPDGKPDGLVQVVGEVAVAVHLAVLGRSPVDSLDDVRELRRARPLFGGGERHMLEAVGGARVRVERVTGL
jgi:hypothetical protein